MDHGLTLGPIQGLESAHTLIYSCENVGLTCVLINKGIVKSMPRPTSIGLIIHLSGSTSLGLAPNRKMLLGSVEEAIRLGADAVSVQRAVYTEGKVDQLGILRAAHRAWLEPERVLLLVDRGSAPAEPDSRGA